MVDKPFTVTLSQARELDALAKAKGLLLSVFHNRSWDSDFLPLKGLLAAGELGEVRYFESHFDRFRLEVRQRWREMKGRAAASGTIWDRTCWIRRYSCLARRWRLTLIWRKCGRVPRPPTIFMRR